MSPVAGMLPPFAGAAGEATIQPSEELEAMAPLEELEALDTEASDLSHLLENAQ